jgi:hypothetical protein
VIPIVNRSTFTVVRWTLSVTVECRQCQAKADVTLVRESNGQGTGEAACPSCGATYDLGGMAWDIRIGQPNFAIASSTPVPVSRN